jgi:hypothetical protein
MSPAQIESFVEECTALKMHTGMDDEYHVVRGDFVAAVQPHANKYSFSVRDTRRERPTIHGFGVDFPNAVVAVTELLDALTGER